MAESAACGLAVDASVLINLLHVDRLALLVDLPAFRVFVPEDVRDEVRLPEQRTALQDALDARRIEPVVLDQPAVLETYANLRERLGRGESACLALAQHRGYSVACDEKRAFLRLARERLGVGRIVTTADLFLMGLHAGLLSVEEADAAKDVLATKRFRMPFGSFRELVGTGDSGGR